MIYSKQEVSDLLKMIEDGNKTTGGLQKVVPLFYGVVVSSEYCIAELNYAKQASSASSALRLDGILFSSSRELQ